MSLHRDFGERIRRHRRELEAYRSALSDFHKHYGALDV